MEAAPSTASPILPCDFSGTSLLTYSHQWKHRSTNSSIGHAAHRTTTAKNCIDSTVDTGKSKPDDGTIVFGLAFLTEDSITSASRSTAQFWIFGCTSRGEVCVWKGSNNTPSASQGDDDDDDEEYDTNRFTFATSRIAGSISSNTSKAPVLRLQMSPQSSNNAEVLYSCQIVPRANAYWLVVSGDHGRCF